MNLFGRRRSKPRGAPASKDPAQTIVSLRGTLDTLEKRQAHLDKQIAKQVAEAGAKAKAEEEARQWAEAEIRAKENEDNRVMAEQARLSAEADAKKRLRNAKQVAEAGAKAKAEEEARQWAEKEAAAKATKETRAKAEAEEKARIKAENARLAAEANARAKAEAEAAAHADSETTQAYEKEAAKFSRDPSPFRKGVPQKITSKPTVPVPQHLGAPARRRSFKDMIGEDMRGQGSTL